MGGPREARRRPPGGRGPEYAWPQPDRCADPGASLHSRRGGRDQPGARKRGPPMSQEEPLIRSVAHWLWQAPQIIRIQVQEEPEDLHSLLRTAEAIQKCLDGEPEHGGFVQAMAKGDYAAAFRNADPVNACYFGALMEYRLYYADDHR